MIADPQQKFWELLFATISYFSFKTRFNSNKLVYMYTTCIFFLYQIEALSFNENEKLLQWPPQSTSPHQVPKCGISNKSVENKKKKKVNKIG